jgi:hypothetical protein
MMHGHKYHAGQAMTETLVTASTVLVPLLLLIPLMGKYIDIKHATIQAARYEAWEYTAWYGNNNIRTGPWSSGERSAGFTTVDGSSLSQPVKSTADTQQESRQRFFSSTQSPISSMDVSGWDETYANNLWKDHRQTRLWEGDIPSGHLPESSGSTPDYSGGVLNSLLDILDAVFGAIAYAMQLVGSDVGFTAINTKGLASSNVMVPVSAPAGLIDFATLTDTGSIDDSTTAIDLEFEAGAAVLTDGWNAGGLGHTINQVGGITPTKILDSLVDTLLDSVPGLGTAWDIVTLLIPEWRRCNPSIDHFMDESPVPDVPESVAEVEQDGSLWLGYINVDAVHPDRLDIGGSHDCPDGICNFDYQHYTPCE